jgi:catechol 2,3-dioxygenase-like lactoylglutathione lyase family enzyme
MISRHGVVPNREVEMNTGKPEAAATGEGTAPTVDMRLEVVVIPVADVDRAKAFYAGLGWRLDADLARGEDFRVVQLTPPGSGCSIIFGAGLTAAKPGSYEGLQLVVSDIEAASAALRARGAEVSEPFHDAGGVFHHAGANARVEGVASDRASYGTFASFQDPDGNTWFVQEVTTRLPGRIDSQGTTYESASDLEEALKRAAAAHGKHEERIGQADAEWPAWYADYMVRERAGLELPT